MDRRHAVFAAILTWILPMSAYSGPLVLEETAKIAIPDPSYSAGVSVAIDGDFALVAASRPATTGNPFEVEFTALLFRRQTNGAWGQVRPLVHVTVDTTLYNADMFVAMENNVAVVAANNNLHFFERAGSDWIEVPQPGVAFTTDIEIDAGTVLASDGSCNWSAKAFRKNTSGSWSEYGSLPGAFRGCDDEFRGGDTDISGNLAVVFNARAEDNAIDHVRVYSSASGPWPVIWTLWLDGANANAPFGPYVALENNTALVSGSMETGTYVFNRNSGGGWDRAPSLRSPGDYMGGGASATLEMSNGFAYQHRWNYDRQAGSVKVFQRQSDGTYRHVAELVANNSFLGRSVDTSNNRVIVASSEGAHIYELPATFVQPALIQDNFQTSNASGWTPQVGSQFSVVASGAARVYRQSSVAGTATSLLTASDWTHQSIQADVKPTQFATADRWFGLATRYTDAQNYYYVTVRSSNVVLLRRIVNGVFITLASAPLAVALNRNYRVRLESIGTIHKVYVDGVLLAQARDTAHTHGRAGITMYQTRADYDNVVATPNPSTTLFANNFESSYAGPWTATGTGLWNVTTDGTQAYFQSSIADGARAWIGVPTDNQIVQARAKVNTFASGAPGQERWFGLMARYRDDGNYYYVTLRNSNTISLRKVTNNAIGILGTANFTVTPGTWYTLRLEAIGNSLRTYVNGNLLLEATDNTHATGTFGPVMYKAATVYDNFLSLQP